MPEERRRRQRVWRSGAARGDGDVCGEMRVGERDGGRCAWESGMRGDARGWESGMREAAAGCAGVGCAERNVRNFSEILIENKPSWLRKLFRKTDREANEKRG